VGFKESPLNVRQTPNLHQIYGTAEEIVTRNLRLHVLP
jgi:hypothetical protein